MNIFMRAHRFLKRFFMPVLYLINLNTGKKIELDNVKYRFIKLFFVLFCFVFVLKITRIGLFSIIRIVIFYVVIRN